MRTDTADFSAKNQLLNKEPRYYIEVMYDNAYTDPYYFTSHNDVALPSTATSANTYSGTLKSISGTSQKVNPIKAVSSIGDGSCEIVDVGGVLTTLLRTKWQAEEALKSKRFRTYVGYKGLSNSDYTLVSTQIKSDQEHNGTSYTFMLEDLQRTIKKDIFVLEETTLSQSVEIDQVAIPVQSTSAFNTNWHDANHTDSPSADVGYISLKPDDFKEVIKYTDKVSTPVTDSGTDISFGSGDYSVNATSTDLSIFTVGQFLNISGSASNDGNYIINTVTSAKITLYALDGATNATIVTESAGATVTIGAPVQFYNCTRGVLNTRPQEYEVDSSISADRREKVTEHVYIETTASHIIYALLTGIWYGTANTCPWSLGIDTSLINAASFFTTPGIPQKILRFSGEKKQDGKRFINEQCALPFAMFTRVLNDGDIALKRFTGVLSDASYVRLLDESEIVSYSDITQSDKEVYNTFSIDWNYEDEKETTTRRSILVDTVSQAKHGVGETTLAMEFRGLHGSATTLQDIYSSFNMMRDRHAGPPLRMSLKVLHRNNDLEIGDVVRVKIDSITDATNRTVTSLDRSFEVQGKTVDWQTGRVTLQLFGSSEKAGELSSTTVSTVMSNTYYQTGQLLSSHLTISGDAVTADGTLTGEDSITSASTYYWESDLTINTGVTVSWTKNVDLRLKGHFTLNGIMEAVGQGDSDGDGPYGATKSGGSLNWNGWIPNDSRVAIQTIRGSTNTGYYDSLPYFEITPDSAGDTLTGVPDDLQGIVGPDGSDTTVTGTATSTGTLTGTAGANGGGGIVISCRGASAGVNGKIKTSGADALPGNIAIINGHYSTQSGAGGGGHCGCALILVDGNDYESTLIADNFEQYIGDSPAKNLNLQNVSKTVGENGFARENRNQSFWRVQYIPDTTTAVADNPTASDTVTAIAPTESTNTPSTVAQNLSTVQIDVTAPSDGNYSYSEIYYKLSTDTEYTYVGPAKDSVLLPPTVMDGSTYDVIARPVSVTGVESPEFSHTTVTVSNTTGGAVMGTGNYIAVGQSAFDTGDGAWIEKTANGVKASFGSSTGNKVLINNDAANIVEITGSITANSGTIGGATISSTQIYNSTNMVLNWSSNYISLNDSTYGNQGIQLQYNSGTPRAYIGDGNTKSFEFDGTDVLMGTDSKLLGTDAYNNDNIYISGALQHYTVADLSSGAGAISQNPGYTGFDVSGSGDSAACYIVANRALSAYSWAKNRRLKVHIESPQNSSNADLYVGMGYTSGRRLCFRFDTDGNVYSECHDGTTLNATSLGTYTANTDYNLEIVFDSGTNAKFYIDGTLKTTETSNLPTGTINADTIIFGQLNWVASGGTTAEIGEFKFIQDE